MKRIFQSSEEQSSAYDSSVWSGDTYGGLAFKLATRKTPLLEGFIKLVRANPAKVIEAGPGEGGQTVKLAQAGFHVAAVESSPKASKIITSRIAEYGLERQVDVVTESIFDYIERLPSGEQRHFYAQGVFQFFSNDDRQKLLQFLSTLQEPGGVIGVSCKMKYAELLNEAS